MMLKRLFWFSESIVRPSTLASSMEINSSRPICIGMIKFLQKIKCGDRAADDATTFILAQTEGSTERVPSLAKKRRGDREPPRFCSFLMV